MAELTTGSTEIDASPDAVMRVLTNFDAYPAWAGVKTAEVRATDATGRPSEVAMTISQMGFEAAYTLAYDYAPDDGGFSWTTKEATGVVKDVQGSYVLQPNGQRTNVTYELALELTISLPGFLKRQAAKQVISMALEGLKQRVEGT